MATRKDRSSPVRPFKRQAKKRTPHPYLDFGTALGLLRQRTGKMQFEIAQEASLTKGMLSSYETGRQRPSLESLIKLLKVLGGDFRDLQDALDAVTKRSRLTVIPPAALNQRELGEEETERERRIGRAVLDVVSSFAEAKRSRSAPQLRIVGSIGGTRLKAG